MPAILARPAPRAAPPRGAYLPPVGSPRPLRDEAAGRAAGEEAVYAAGRGHRTFRSVTAADRPARNRWYPGPSFAPRSPVVPLAPTPR
ncbi:hypothetical protein GCM10010385_31650 [Streptomyces geysiriensis]|nr:hypothetical protein GCM10010385_31650 [Streptomyces geysiriensis]